MNDIMGGNIEKIHAVGRYLLNCGEQQA